MRVLEPVRMMTLAATLVLAAGCGSNDADTGTDADTTADAATSEESAAAPREADYLDACKLKMTSPDAREWQTSWDPRGKIMLGEGPSMVHSTYWAEDASRQKYIDAKAPPFSVTCSYENAEGQDEIMVVIEARGQLTEAEVPYGPGTYPIVARSQDANAPKGFWVFPLLYGEAMFEATGGTLTITRFDDKGTAGSFRFEGKEQLGERTIAIEGTFDMPCRGGPSEEKCAAGKAIVD